jgi:hypothetical protein
MCVVAPVGQARTVAPRLRLEKTSRRVGGQTDRRVARHQSIPRAGAVAHPVPVSSVKWAGQTLARWPAHCRQIGCRILSNYLRRFAGALHREAGHKLAAG